MIWEVSLIKYIYIYNNINVTNSYVINLDLFKTQLNNAHLSKQNESNEEHRLTNEQQHIQHKNQKPINVSYNINRGK